MAVSTFLKNPIQNNFSEIRFAHQNPLSRFPDPSGPGGYMRKRALEQSDCWSAAHLPPPIAVTGQLIGVSSAAMR